MSTVPIQIYSRNEKKLVDAILHAELKPDVLVSIEGEWGPLRLAAARKHYRAKRMNLIPNHFQWDWGLKSSKLQYLSYRCLGIHYGGKWQGLLMVQTTGKVARLPNDKGKDLIYVDYLESAPWNLATMVDVPLYGGVGTVLMQAAVQLSYDEGFHGRIGLHALPQSEEFYRDDCGMTFCGNDASYENLAYYEMTREIASEFMPNTTGGVV